MEFVEGVAVSCWLVGCVLVGDGGVEGRMKAGRG